MILNLKKIQTIEKQGFVRIYYKKIFTELMN